MPRKAKEEILNETTESKINKKTKAAATKTTAKKSTTKTSTAKKSTTKAKTTAAKTSAKKSATGKSITKATKSSAKNTTEKTKKKTTTKKTASKKATPVVLEYYDLPYGYNKTVVKALAQNPNTLFVYWEISDEDRNSFISQYGENFFNTTKPVLVIHNLTDKYSYEIDINDFANNWYIHVDDAKCQYVVELARRPFEHTDKIPDDFLSITSSNVIEAPNDHVLFYKNSDKILFKNIKTNKYTEMVIKPFLNNILNIYNDYNLGIGNIDDLHGKTGRFDFNNPSSQSPTSNVLKY